MSLFDDFDRRALALGALPIVVFLVLLVRCFLPPALGLAATAPFAGAMLLSYVPLVYLGMFRAWGDLWPREEKPDDPSGSAKWGWYVGSLISAVGSSGAFVMMTCGIARLHWSLLDMAKEQLRKPQGNDIAAVIERMTPPPTGVDLFGPSLVILGILLPLSLVGVLWLLLPSRP